VVYESKEEEVLPLAMETDHPWQKLEKNDESMDGVDLTRNINNVAVDGDLSPKKVTKLRDSHTNKKGQNAKVKDIIGAQASSRQSKRTILKNPKYQ